MGKIAPDSNTLAKTMERGPIGTSFLIIEGGDGYERSRKCLARAVDEFMLSIKSQNLSRVLGTGVFLTRTTRDAPPVMIWHVKHNRALQENLFILNALTESVLRVKNSDAFS